MSKRPLIIANWKGYIESLEDAKHWMSKIGRAKVAADIWVAMPAVFIPLFAKSALPRGAQAVSPLGAGAHTGEVTAAMAKEVGASFALVGHSERRALGETNDAVREQVARALGAGLTAVLCVGERAREADGSHFAYIEEQLRSALEGSQSSAKKLVVAYEPVWAIGKSAEAAMKPAELEEMVIFIRKVLAEILTRPVALRAPILYGGSVEPTNAQALLREGGAGGLLVGHASANPEEFIEILKSCRQ